MSEYFYTLKRWCTQNAFKEDISYTKFLEGREHMRQYITKELFTLVMKECKDEIEERLLTIHQNFLDNNICFG